MKKLLLFMLVAGLLAMFAVVVGSDQTAQLSGQEVILSQESSAIQVTSIEEVAIASQEDAQEEESVVLVANTERQEGTMETPITGDERTGIGKTLAVIGSENSVRRLAAAPPSAADGIMAISVISIV